MIFKSIYLEKGMFHRSIEFKNGVNIIHSKSNSEGKTTLLRFILYALGYSIPSTKNIKFAEFYVKLNIITEKHGEVELIRNNLENVEVRLQGEKYFFSIPEQQNQLHYYIYNTKNINILNNILGAYYVDQEKGWTLLNRGCVIGKIHFNIEQLIRGLSDIDCSSLIEEKKETENLIKKYRSINSIYEYKKNLDNELGIIGVDSYNDRLISELDTKLIEMNQEKKELSRINRTISDNKKFIEYISDLKLMVKDNHGEIIFVEKDNIVEFTDMTDFLIAKKKNILNRILELENTIIKLQKECEKESNQVSFYESANEADIFDRRIARIPINEVALNKEMSKLKNNNKRLNDEINKKTKENNKVISKMKEMVLEYLTEMEIKENESADLFTSNLKELSGAVLYKNVFAFKLAYIKSIENKLGFKLPIILDSPSGKEVDRKNIELMTKTLKNTFSDNQIIIASIYKYDFDEPNIIKIEKKLIEDRKYLKSNDN